MLDTHPTKMTIRENEKVDYKFVPRSELIPDAGLDSGL